MPKTKYEFCSKKYNFDIRLRSKIEIDKNNFSSIMGERVNIEVEASRTKIFSFSPNPPSIAWKCDSVYLDFNNIT